MIASASILPLTEQLRWGRAKNPAQTTLPVVTFDAPLSREIVNYRLRDQELAYRDLVIGALLTQVALRAGDVWQFAPQRPQLPAAVEPTLEAVAADLPTGGIEDGGPVTHVQHSSQPLEAVAVDRDLYARDLILYHALARAAEVFPGATNPLDELSSLTDQVSSIGASDAWSLADGFAQRLASVGFALPLDVALFQ